jgi:MYXO-CTERM domain-containing protein
MRIFALAVLLLGCQPADEPAWQDGELGEWQPGLTVSGAGGCSTFIVDGLSQQLIAEQNCIRPGALISFKGATGVSIGSNVYPFLEATAHDGLVAAAQAHTLDVSSAFRTLAQQYLLYKWYQAGQCGISLAAVPGNSNHETGIAVDLSNYSSVITTMTNHGFSHTYPSSDPVHFDYTGAGVIDLRNESVLAFQKLWNLNNPGDKIAEDGDYGPQTGARVAKSPADGFAKGSTCAAQNQPAPSNPPPSMPPAPSNPPSPEPSTQPSMEPSTPPSAEPSTAPSPDPSQLPPETPDPSSTGPDDPRSNDLKGGCAVGGTPDASLLTFVIVGFACGRRRRRDVP